MTVGIGVIGAGIMGERLLRAALEHARDAVHVTGVWDQQPAALERIAHLGVPRAASAEALIEAADCVYVATPPGTHLHYARAALDAGRAVFLEKPLAVDVADAARFIERHGTARVAVNFPFASSVPVERLREWLEAGVTGAPRGFAIDVAFRAWPRPWQHDAAAWLDGPAEGGFTREVVSHFLFLSRRLLGPLSLLSSEVRAQSGASERQVTARLDAGGLPGRLVGAVTGEARPMVLRRQLEGVAAMTRGEPHRLATAAEAFEVQRVVEAILSGRAAPEATRRE